MHVSGIGYPICVHNASQCLSSHVLETFKEKCVKQVPNLNHQGALEEEDSILTLPVITSSTPPSVI